MMKSPSKSLQDIYPRISEEIRNRDIIGMGTNGDYYILLSQADQLAAQDIAERLTRFGFPSEIIETSQVLKD